MYLPDRPVCFKVAHHIQGEESVRIRIDMCCIPALVDGFELIRVQSPMPAKLYFRNRVARADSSRLGLPLGTSPPSVIRATVAPGSEVTGGAGKKANAIGLAKGRRGGKHRMRSSLSNPEKTRRAHL